MQPIGGYELREKVRKSTSGTVYRGHNPLLGRESLVKLMPLDAAEYPDALKRFHREIRLTAQLSHPNLVSALHAGEENGTCFLVLQNIQGTDLQTKVLRDGSLASTEAVEFTRQAAEGLAFLHHNGVVHRNVKPANLMLDQAGVVHVMNFMTALIDADASVDTEENEELTQQGQVLGTSEFLSPEQAFDSHSADARSDIYSLGCTLYYLLTGKIPYPSEGAHRKATAHIQQPIPRLAAARSDVTPELDAVFARMVAKMPVDRYQSMQEVIRDLQRIANGTRPELGSFTGEEPNNWVATATIACAGVGAGVVALALAQLALRAG